MTFTEVEAQIALQAVEQLLIDMVAGKLDLGELGRAGECISKQQRNGAYPCTAVWLMTHQHRYPDASLMFGMLLYALVRSRAEAIKGPVQ